MEQRFKEQTRTVSKQYGPKVEAVMSGVLLAASIAIFLVYTLV